jgi:hypothetical protein
LWCAQHGRTPAGDLFSEEYLVALFRPHTRVKVRREAVLPYSGMRYWHEVLGDWNGKEVVVAYDIMDWQQVWVSMPPIVSRQDGRGQGEARRRFYLLSGLSGRSRSARMTPAIGSAARAQAVAVCPCNPR